MMQTRCRLYPHLYRRIAHRHRFMATADRSNLVKFSSRLRDGRALAEDVWSIYKCVSKILDPLVY